MKKFVLFSVLMAVLLSACGTYEDVSSVFESSAVEDASSEDTSYIEEVSSEDCSSETEPIVIPEDEPYDLTPLSDEEIANLILPEGYNEIGRAHV